MQKEAEFLPANGAHAIVSCQVSLIFSRPLPDSGLENINSIEADLMGELPEKGDMVALSVNNGSITVGKLGVEYKKLDENKNALWQLQITKEQITVVCSDYKRWDIIYPEMRRYVSRVLDAVKVEDLAVKELSLKVVDQFLTTKTAKGYDLSAVISPTSPYVVAKAFNTGPHWHSNSGWFDDLDGAFPRVLNNLTVSVTDGARNLEPEGMEDIYVVTLDHVLFLREGSLPELSKSSHLFEANGGLADQAFSLLHKINKDVIASTLTKGVSAKIGLKV